MNEEFLKRMQPEKPRFSLVLEVACVAIGIATLFFVMLFMHAIGG